MKKNVEPGSFVGPGMTLFAVANTETVKIIVECPDTAVRSIRLGQPVDVTVDAFADRSFRARITRIASAADRRHELRGRGRHPQPRPRAEEWA